MPSDQRVHPESVAVQLKGLHASVSTFEPPDERGRSSIGASQPAKRPLWPARGLPARPLPRRRTEDQGVVGAIAEAPARTRIHNREQLYRRALVVADGVAALLAIVIAATILGDDSIGPATLAVLPLVVLIYKIAGLYERDQLVLKRSTLDEAPLLFQLSGLFALATWLLGDRLIAGELGREQILGLWGALFATSFGGRLLARSYAGHRATSERCLVIGTSNVAERVRQKMRDSKVNACVVATMPHDQPLMLGLGKGIEPFRAVVSDLYIDRVILAPVSTDSADMLDLIRGAKAAGVRVSVLPRMLEVVGTSMEFDDLDGMAMLGIRRFGLSRSSRTLKRAFDLVGAGIGVVLVSPLLAALALAVRIDSRGPIMFRQTRVGRDGQRFQMIKFRSMGADAEQRKAGLVGLNEAVGLFKISDDPRITRVGRFIRKTSLDELPQLYNVLRGDMSLVGPRPLVVDEDAQVEGLLRSRLHLTPGMTGPWQVLGSSRIPMAEMLKIDYLYVAGWSLWADVKLLLRTVPHMISRRGA